MSEKAICGLCGEPMPAGEEMFNYHGLSGPCPKPPLPTPPVDYRDCLELAGQIAERVECYEGDDLLGQIIPAIKPVIGELIRLRRVVESRSLAWAAAEEKARRDAAEGGYYTSH